MSQQLDKLLQLCTVKLTIVGKRGWGTGFFVAPGLILTCSHVVQSAANRQVNVTWMSQQQNYEATIGQSSSGSETSDLALLHLSDPVPKHPCIYLDEAVQSGDNLCTFGYPDKDFPQGCPVTFVCEGLTGDQPPLIKFKLGQVRPGMSGAPLLNWRTGKVCGVVKFTRDRSLDLGGGAIPTTTIFDQFSTLKVQHDQFHQQNQHWLEALPSARNHHWFEAPPSLPSQTRLSRRQTKNRQALLNKVRNFWIKGVLEKSVHNATLIELELEERLDLLDCPWGIVWETPDQLRQILPDGSKVIHLFNQMGEGGTLLILGEPGAGKTITLLELARDLIYQAEQDVDHPIPVVFNLASWERYRKPIADWLMRELKEKYQVPKALSEPWLQDQQLLLLLDGLDEVRESQREACIHALNQFVQKNGNTRIVVCSRIRDYEKLTQRLKFQGAIHIKSLTLEQAKRYLAIAGKQLTGVSQALQTDATLQELVKSPLMLNIIMLTYCGIAVAELPNLSSVEAYQTYIFDAYIDCMFFRRRIKRSNNKYLSKYQQYPKAKAIKWLKFLAHRMFKDSQTIFFIEQMQLSWLQTPAQQLKYRISFPLIGLSIGTMLIGPILYTWHVKAFQILGKTVDGPSEFWGIILIVGISCALFLGILGSLRDITPAERKLTDVVRWSEETVWVSLIAWMILLLSGGLLIRIRRNWLFILLWTFIWSWAIELPGKIIADISNPPDLNIEDRMKPNQGIKQSGINAGILFLIVALPSTSILLFIAWVGSKPGVLLDLARHSSLLLGLSLGFIAALLPGFACIQHFILRCLLFQRSDIPWNYSRFLDYATERIFLQKIGGGYIFIHRLLQEHLANMVN